MLLAMNSQHSTANQTPLNLIGPKFICPQEVRLDLLLITLTKHYILQ